MFAKPAARFERSGFFDAGGGERRLSPTRERETDYNF
jgi:hypothetical protein